MWYARVKLNELIVFDLLEESIDLLMLLNCSALEVQDKHDQDNCHTSQAKT